jgi:hypothetical protein
MVRTARLVLSVALLTGCGSSAVPLANVPTAAPTLSPVIIYVTPAPTAGPTPTPIIIYVTPPPTATPAPTPNETPKETLPPPTQPPDTTGDGTRDNPYGLGQDFIQGDWEVTVVDVDEDAWPRIKKQNMFNDPPPGGDVEVMFLMSIRYLGSDSSDPSFGISTSIVGPLGNTFDDYCGVLPEGILEVGDMFNGASTEANDCVQVPVDQVSGATIRFQDFSTFSDSDVFVALP